MNYVEPIKDLRKLSKMKKLMRKESKIRELALFEIGIKTGLRISDILKLTWIDVLSDLGNEPTFRQSITIKEKKTKKSRQFRFSDNVKKCILELYKEVKPDEADFLFKSKSNSVAGSKSSWTRQYVWQFLNDYAYRSGIRSKIGTHTLRKTFGYHAYKNGVDLSLLMRIFNHSSQDVTLRYIGITQDQIDEVYVNLDRIL